MGLGTGQGSLPSHRAGLGTGRQIDEARGWWWQGREGGPWPGARGYGCLTQDWWWWQVRHGACGSLTMYKSNGVV